VLCWPPELRLSVSDRAVRGGSIALWHQTVAVVPSLQAWGRGRPPARRLSAASDTIDTDGRLLMVNLTTADISDSAGAQAILDGIRKRWALGEASVRRQRL
jgi:hypothetical protein